MNMYYTTEGKNPKNTNDYDRSMTVVWHKQCEIYEQPARGRKKTQEHKADRAKKNHRAYQITSALKMHAI